MLNVKFFPNTKRDIHCMQACMQMILKYYYPNKTFSKKKLNELLKIKNKNMAVFPDMAVIVFSRLGINSKYIIQLVMILTGINEAKNIS